MSIHRSIREFGRRPRTYVIAAGLAVAAVGLQATMSSGSPTIVIRGDEANPDTFSLTTLRSRADRDMVETVRRKTFEDCMAAKGFTEPPESEGKYANEYALAGFGDDASSTEPTPTRTVEIADGISAKITATWTPESCFFKSYSTFGVDPFVREALRERMMALLTVADEAAAESVAPIALEWGKCFGQASPGPQDLLNAIDGVALERSPYGDAASNCLTDDIRQAAVRARAKEHLRVAADNDAIVQAWVTLIDEEFDAVSAAQD